MKKVAPFLIVIGAIVIALILNQLKPEPTKAPLPEAALAVNTEIVFSTDVVLDVESQGTVKARTQTQLVSEVTGVVLEVSDQYVVGGVFDAGDILMRLDPTDYEVTLQRAQAQLISRQALLELEKARAAQASKEWEMTGRPRSEAPLLAIRQPYLAEAEANILQAKAEVKQAQRKLDRTTIRAPYDGMVSAKNVDVGQYVTVGSRLGETFAIDFAEVRLPLTEKDLSKMEPLTFQGIPVSDNVILKGSVNGTQAVWNARAVRSEGVVNTTNRSQYLVARVSDPYGLKRSKQINSSPLLIGTFVKAKLEGRLLKNVFKVPRSGLLQGSKVATVDDAQRLRIKAVEISFADDDYYYVTGLEDGTEIAVSAIGTPIEGLQLQVKRSLIQKGAE